MDVGFCLDLHNQTILPVTQHKEARRTHKGCGVRAGKWLKQETFANNATHAHSRGLCSVVVGIAIRYYSKDGGVCFFFYFQLELHLFCALDADRDVKIMKP